MNKHGCNKAGTGGADSHGQDGHLAVLGSWGDKEISRHNVTFFGKVRYKNPQQDEKPDKINETGEDRKEVARANRSSPAQLL